MRILSVVFIFATLAIFGVMAQRNKDNCKIQCPEGADDRTVCVKVGKQEFTSAFCTAAQLVKCVYGEERELVYTEGNCVVDMEKSIKRRRKQSTQEILGA